MFDISQSQHQTVRVSRGSNKKSFAIKLFQFCNLETSKVISSKRNWRSPKENSLVWPTVFVIFSKLLITLASAYRFPYRSPKLRLDRESQKTISLLITITISLNIQIDKFVCHSDLETTILAYFPSKSLNYTAINFISQKLSTLVIVEFTISTRTDITLQTDVKYSRAITMCSAFTPDSGYGNSTINLIGVVYCPNTKCLGKLCLHKKTFQSLGRSNYQCPQCGSVCQVRNIPFEDQTNSCFLSLGQGV